MRPRARDHHTSSTLVGGNCGAGPTSRLHTTMLEGPTDRVSMWMQYDGCKVYMDSYLRGIERIVFHGHLDYFQKPPLGGRPNTKSSQNHGTTNVDKRWFILFCRVWGPTWIEIHWNSMWLRAQSQMTSHYTWGSVTTLHDFEGGLETALDTLFWALTGSHNLMVTALGLCVKWPFVT
jgi:hypothetical protein